MRDSPAMELITKSCRNILISLVNATRSVFPWEGMILTGFLHWNQDPSRWWVLWLTSATVKADFGQQLPWQNDLEIWKVHRFTCNSPAILLCVSQAFFQHLVQSNDSALPQPKLSISAWPHLLRTQTLVVELSLCRLYHWCKKNPPFGGGMLIFGDPMIPAATALPSLLTSTVQPIPAEIWLYAIRSSKGGMLHCPYLLLPTATAQPSLRISTVWEVPAEIWMYAMPSFKGGMLHCPCVLFPMATALPSLRRSTVWLAPAEILVLWNFWVNYPQTSSAREQALNKSVPSPNPQGTKTPNIVPGTRQ